MIPVAYAPSSVVLDEADNVPLVANDKGLGQINRTLLQHLKRHDAG
jgi:hypothetical protein